MPEHSEASDRATTVAPADAVLDPVVYDRIMTAATFQEPDRVPIWDYVDSWPIYQHFAPGETDPVPATAKVFHGLGIDMCRSVFIPQAPESEGVEHDHGSHKTKVSGKTHWVSQYPVKSLEDIRAWQGGVPTEADVWPEVEHVLRIRDTMAPQTLYVPGCGMGFHAAYGMMGLALFSTALYDVRDEIQRIIDTLNRGSCVRA